MSFDENCYLMKGACLSNSKDCDYVTQESLMIDYGIHMHINIILYLSTYNLFRT